MRWPDVVGWATVRAYLPQASWINPGRPFWLALGLSLLLGGLLYGGRATRQARRLTGWRSALPQTMVTLLAKAQDSVWVGSPTNLWQCSNELECIEIPLPAQGSLTGLAATAAGMWCSTTQGLWLWNGSWQRMPVTDTITTMAVDDRGCLWSLGEKLHHYCAGSWQVVRLPMLHPLAMTAGAHVWVGGKDGISRWDESLQSWSQLHGGGTCMQDVRALAAAPDGSLWVGTGGHGVCHYNGMWEQFTPATRTLPYSVVHSITPTETGMWLTTESPAAPDGAVAYFTGQQWTIWTPRNTGLASGYAFAILDNGPNVWFATLMGLSVWQKPD